MARTLVEAIIAAHTRDEVQAGNICKVAVDFAFANDITAPPAIREFKKMGGVRVFDPARCAIVPDHFTPAKDIASAEQAKFAKEFAREQNLLYWEVGRVGVEHAFLPEQGLVLPGDIVVGADSHTCTGGALGALGTGMGQTDLAAIWALGETWLRVPETLRAVYDGTPSPWVGGKDYILSLIGQIGVEGARYMAIEFDGEGIAALPMDDRFTIANMAIEAGGKCGLFAADGKTLEYTKAAGRAKDKEIAADPGAEYENEINFDVSALTPLVACPHLPENVHPVDEVRDVRLDQVVIGSCTNGRISDLREAAEILKGRQVDRNVRCIVLPATPAIWKQALTEGLIETFMDSGCIVGPATCGPCLGGHMGILAEGERAVATTNRNFRGRMGSLESEVYLANPAVAAASAVAGEISHPGKL